jgi:hypothetical protein
MKKYLLAAASALALTSGASAFEGGNWLLLSLHWENGTGYVYGDPFDFAADPHRPIPSFATKGACQVSLRHELERHAGLSHADGGDAAYLCAPVSALALPS